MVACLSPVQVCTVFMCIQVCSDMFMCVRVCLCTFACPVFMQKVFFLVCEHHLLVSHVLGFFFIKPNFKKTKNNNLFSFSLEFVSCLCKSWRFYAA